MAHALVRVVGFQRVGPFALSVCFDDGSERQIDFRSRLKGAMYEPLLDERVFSSVKLDPEVGTLVWENGADFDPDTLYHWPEE